MEARRYTDEELSAWVDGEGTAAERAEIEAWLRGHAAEAARVSAWQADREALRAAYAPVAQEAVPSALAAAVWSPTRPRRALHAPWGLAAAAVAGVFLLGALVGGVVAWQLKASPSVVLARPGASAAGALGSESWLRRAAFAHAVYTPEPRHAVEVKAQEEHLARWLTRRIEAPVKLFDLRPLGFELVGGRLLPDGAGKSAQLMYQDAEGKRITVYLRKPEPGTDAAFRFERQGKLGLFYWIEEKTGFALVGDLPKERLLALAKSIYDQDWVLPQPSMVVPAAASAAGSGAGSAAAALPASSK